MTTEIIMYDSPEAAEFRTNLCGWVSRDGRYWGDGPQSESMARYAGCTHRPCRDCGAETSKLYLVCDACRRKADLARYEAMPEAEWDGMSMLYSELRDEYFVDLSEANDSLKEGQTLLDLRLVICRPVYASPLDYDHFVDDLPEDGDLPAEVKNAIDAFNLAIKGVLLAWCPGKSRLKPSEDAEFTTGTYRG